MKQFFEYADSLIALDLFEPSTAPHYEFSRSNHFSSLFAHLHFLRTIKAGCRRSFSEENIFWRKRSGVLNSVRQCRVLPTNRTRKCSRYRSPSFFTAASTERVQRCLSGRMGLNLKLTCRSPLLLQRLDMYCFIDPRG